MVPSPNSRSSHSLRSLRSLELPREFEFELVRTLAFATGNATFAEGGPTLGDGVVDVERYHVHVGVAVEHSVIDLVHVY